MSLRAKLVLALVLLTSMAAISIGIWSYAATSRLINDQIDHSLEASAIVAGGGGGRAPDAPHRDGDDIAVEPSRVSDQNVTQVLAADGDRVAGSSTVVLPIDDLDQAVAGGAVASVRRNVAVDGVPYRMLTTGRNSGPGAVQVARSLTETDRVLDSLRNLTLVATALIVALAAAVGWLIARQVTRRLARLTGVAEEVAATGRLDVPVPVDGTDEAGRLGGAFNEMLIALGRSRDAQQRLVQDAGHELRTPLTSLRTNVSVLRRHESLPPETRTRVIEDLDAETRELTGLVNELVELATDARDDEPHQHVELGPLAERVAERARRRTGRRITVTADGSVVDVRPQALERVVSNLLDNAAKFDALGPSGAPPAAAIEPTAAGEQVEPIEVDITAGRLEVRDRGPGIPADDLPRVFDRFYRSVGARSRPGSGLGLAIVRDIVEAHGGTVSAGNRPGGGAVVGFTLPTV
ncbi:MAG TPA: HAMP domain-containing sensor histidine kinase [Acidimicrobiales bacterium]